MTKLFKLAWGVEWMCKNSRGYSLLFIQFLSYFYRLLGEFDQLLLVMAMNSSKS